jgi:hypothetical protein
MFKQAHSTPLSTYILETPQHKKPLPSTQNQLPDQEASAQRQSSRLKGENSNGKTIVRMAQDLIAKKWGHYTS